MKIVIFLFIIFTCISSYSQLLNSAERTLLEDLNKNYAIDNSAVSFNYAWLLYRSGEKSNYPRADSVLNRQISLQDDIYESFTYGHWCWRIVNGERFVDWNSALFQSHILFRKLWEQQYKMESETQENFLRCCERVLEAAVRRWDQEIFDIYRDYTAYSNIFAMYIQTFVLAGERYDSPRLRKTAYMQWTRWYNHISFFGIDEFASPGYNFVVFRALIDIHDFTSNERIKKEAKEIMNHIYLLQSAITHPLLKLPVSGISRDYRNFLEPGDMRSGVLLPENLPEDYTPPQKALKNYENRKYPFEVIGKAAAMPFIFKSFQLEDAAVGSMTGGACFQQQIHCIAAVGKNENERAVAFLQGSYTPVNGYTDQKETSTLCVYNRLPAYWHLTQKHGIIDMSKYKESFGEFGVGISADWKEKLKTQDHIILAAYGYDLHIFPFALKDEKIVPCDLTLKHRTTTSPRYHPRPRIFDEYVFPEEPEWFGAYITLVKSGSKVKNPMITYKNNNELKTFRTKMGHQVQLFITEKGDTRQIYNVDPAFIPLLKFTE